MPRRSKPDHRRAVAYLRVSTDEQHLGLEAQRAAIEAWAAREGVELVAWHDDLGVSGGTALEHRPGLVGAVSSLREHRAGLLVVAKRDRLARDVGIAATVDAAAVSLGARVVAADGAGNEASAAGAFLRVVLDGAAMFERGLIRERTKAALAAKKARGERVGQVPYGFKLDPRDGRRIIEDEVEQVAIRAALALRREGRSVRAIADELERLAYRSRGRRWNKSTVGRLLQRYEGQVAA
jgi:DNA invertase Pin-like site-specific DNA recombinase